MTPEMFAEHREAPVAPGFCPTVPMQPLLWDATRLRVAMTCWRKHYYKTVRGLRGNTSSSIHLDFGSAYHESVEAYDQAILDGLTHEEARVSAFMTVQAWAAKPVWGESMTVWKCSDPEMVEAKRIKVWRHFATDEIRDCVPAEHVGEWELVPKMVTNRERCYLAKGWVPFLDDGEWPSPAGRCMCGKPVTTNTILVPHNKVKTPETLVLAVEAYCASASAIAPYKFPDGTSGLELQVRLPLPISAPDGTPYELLGNIDSLVEWEGEIAIRERKTTARALTWQYWAQFDPDPQIDTYDLLGSVLFQAESGRPPRIMVEAMRITTGGKVEIERHPIYIPESRREEWFRELQSVISDAEMRAEMAEVHSPEAAFPRNTSACRSGFFTCPFLDLCRAAPKEREEIIKTNYHVERWNPETRVAEFETPEEE